MTSTASEAGVSSVVGTVLMLAVTVSVFGGLSVVVLSEIQSVESPPEAELAFVRDGDRAILAHRGGESVPLAGGFLLLNVAGSEVRFELTDVAGQTADGEHWRLGETLCLSGPSPPDPGRACLLEDRPVLGAAVVAGGGLLADEGERGGPAGPCPLDDVAPTLDPVTPWSLSPADVLSTTTGTVTVTVTATDDCSGMDDTAAPVLFYRINDGSPPGYSSAGSMTNAGPGQWSQAVPSQSWNLLGGQSLEYYVSGLSDLNGNEASDTAAQSELIDTVTLVTYVTAATPVVGSVDALDPAQDGADGDATTLSEAGTTGSPVSNGPTKFSGTSAATGGAVSATNVLTSNDARGELDATGDWIEVTGFDLPSNADSVTAIVIGYEGRKDSSGGTSPTTRLDYKIGSASYDLGSSITESATTDTERTRTLTGTFSVADVESMTVRVYLVTDTNRNPQVDHLFATVTYTTPAVTTYSLDITLDFMGTADGASETLELRYKTTGDTFHVEVWDGTTFVDQGTLSSTGSFATFTYPLATAGEYNGGAPQVRIRDVTTTGTTAGSLQIDFARMVTT